MGPSNRSIALAALAGDAALAMVFLWAALAVLATNVAGQAVSGTLTEALAGAPVGGAWIVLEDPQGSRVAGALSHSDGTFFVRAEKSGRYRLVVELIGYAPTRTEPFLLPDRATVRHDLRLDLDAIDLGVIRAVAGSRCRVRPGSGEETHRLWEEARKALEVARWTEEQGTIRFGLTRLKRVLDLPGRRVLLQEALTSRTGLYRDSPFKTPHADSLQAHGWVQERDDGTYFFGPDAAALLSQAFLSQHCFRVVDSDASASGRLVGLGFEPLGEPDRADIRGVLWLDRTSGELAYIAFQYVALPFASRRDWPEVGGEVYFERLPNGMWVVRQWQIRTPLLAMARHGRSRRPELAGLRELVGEVTWARDARDGTPLLEPSTTGVSGTVTDGRGRPLRGAEVIFDGLPFYAVTDTGGHYRIPAVPPGRYAVQVRYLDSGTEILPGGWVPGETDSAGDGSGTGGPAGNSDQRTIDVHRGETERLDLAVTRSADPIAQLCAERTVDALHAILLQGTVTDLRGGSVPNALIRIRRAGQEGAEPVFRGVTDDSGGWQICADANWRTVQIAAVRLQDMLEALPADQWRTVLLGHRGHLSVDLPLAQLKPSTTGRPGVGGRVVDSTTDEPVPGALVTIADSAGTTLAQALTDERGAFRLSRLPPGMLLLDVETAGYTSPASSIHHDGRSIFLEVAVEPAPIRLEGIDVTVTPQKHHLRELGFYDRMESGRGHFVTPEQVASFRATRPAELLRGAPGVMRGTSGEPIFLRSLMQGLRGPCFPTLYLDGSVVRMDPGEPTPLTSFDQLMPPPELIDAVEIYPGAASVPAQWGGVSAGCGVIAVWTRR